MGLQQEKTTWGSSPASQTQESEAADSIWGSQTQAGQLKTMMFFWCLILILTEVFPCICMILSIAYTFKKKKTFNMIYILPVKIKYISSMALDQISNGKSVSV